MSRDPGRCQQRGICQPTAESDRAGAGRSGRLRRVGVELLPRLEGSIAAASPRPRKEAFRTRAYEPLRHRPEPGVELGYYVDASCREGPILLLVHGA